MSVVPYYFHFPELKTSLSINFDARFTQAQQLAQSSLALPHFQNLVAFSTRLVQTFNTQRQVLQQNFDAFQAGKTTFESVEKTLLAYLAIVRGLYDYEGSGITPGTYHPGHSPMDILRASVYFFWSGSLCADGQLAINDAVYEVICILFNLNVCQIREIQKMLNESTPATRDDLEKKTYNLFLKMAGVYDFMIMFFKGIRDIDRTPMDMRNESLEALKLLSLANAQEMAISRMSTKEGKDESLSKLCLDTCNKYKNVQSKFACFPNNAEDNRTKAFSLYLSVKAKFYEALTYMYLGTYYNANDKNGHALFCEKKCLSLLDGTLKEHSAYSKSLKDTKPSRDAKLFEKMIRDAKTLAQQRLDKYQKENDRIYHDSVSTECPMCEPQGIGKPVDFSLPPSDGMWNPGVYMLFSDPTKRVDYVPPPPPEPSAVVVEPAQKGKDCVVM